MSGAHGLRGPAVLKIFLFLFPTLTQSLAHPKAFIFYFLSSLCRLLSFPRYQGAVKKNAFCRKMEVSLNSPPVSFVTLGESLNLSEPHFLTCEKGEQLNTHKGFNTILEQIKYSIKGGACFHFLPQDINPAFSFHCCSTTGVGICQPAC